MNTEHIDPSSRDLDLLDNEGVLARLLASQQQALRAVEQASAPLADAVAAAADRLAGAQGRLVMAGAGASGRLAVQDGAELWPTFGWPAERLLLQMAGGEAALIHSIEGAEDDAILAAEQVREADINGDDVVLAVAASGRSPWTCAWLREAGDRGALTIGMASNADTPLLTVAACPIWLESGAEVLAGSTRMAAGTAQKIALNLFSTTLMIRLNRTYGNLMVDMAATNVKLDERRMRLLLGVVPETDEALARESIAAANGWVKLAVLLTMGDSVAEGRARLEQHSGSLRAAMASIGSA